MSHFGSTNIDDLEPRSDFFVILDCDTINITLTHVLVKGCKSGFLSSVNRLTVGHKCYILMHFLIYSDFYNKVFIAKYFLQYKVYIVRFYAIISASSKRSYDFLAIRMD